MTMDSVIFIAAPDPELDHAAAYYYDGSLELEILAPDETVTAAGDDSGACVITTKDGSLRVAVGSWLIRTPDGRLAVTDYDLTTLRPVDTNG